MSIAVTFGSNSQFVEAVMMAVMPSLVAAAAALFGVWLSNRNAERQQDRAEATRREARDLDRGLSALALAEHLEDFTLHCVDVVISNSSVVWETPYEAEEYSESPLWLKPLPDWPTGLDWRQIGFDLAVKASNFRRRVQFAMESIRAQDEHLDHQDLHEVSAEYAAKLGKEAWSIAVETRAAAGLAAFEWPDGWNGLEIIERFEAKQLKKLEQARAADDL